ncbi:type II secretion system protein [Clostridium sp. D2Q-14]|uniref:type II secretion system protein n=1 Tax=Anaeromonas gelatinilytica TaxID=2683194 RepID=UPI00193C6387|nr:type II secretion system protein [Anaeromonas gelatinilytica]MBS4536193.1 type II secretion system protein [Anaeromonas gelatinilytica]
MNNKGITIVELILVLSIFLVIIGIILPRIDISDYILKSYGRKLVSDLNYIKINSMSNGIGASNRIIFNEKRYNIKVGNKPSKNIYLKSNYKISQNISSNRIYFNPNGSPSQACTITIFNNDNERYIEITITPATGRIHMYDKIRQGYNENLKYE